jgi:DUF1365 family protein
MAVLGVIIERQIKATLLTVYVVTAMDWGAIPIYFRRFL